MRTTEKNKILMVDDDEAIRDCIAELLSMAGYTVTLSSDGSESLRIFETEPFDLVITDHDAGDRRVGGHDQNALDGPGD